MFEESGVTAYKDMTTPQLIKELEKELENEDSDRIIAICRVLVTRPRVRM